MNIINYAVAIFKRLTEKSVDEIVSVFTKAEKELEELSAKYEQRIAFLKHSLDFHAKEKARAEAISQRLKEWVK